MTSARIVYIFLLYQEKANEMNPFVYILLYSLTESEYLKEILMQLKCLPFNDLSGAL